MVETTNKLLRLSRSFVQEFGREPTPEELARRWAFASTSSARCSRSRKSHFSLETPVGDEGDTMLGDFIGDTNLPSPAEVVLDADLAAQTQKLLQTLTPREQKVLRMRFGIEERQSTPSEKSDKSSRSRASASARSKPRRCASSHTRSRQAPRSLIES